MHFTGGQNLENKEPEGIFLETPTQAYWWPKATRY